MTRALATALLAVLSVSVAPAQSAGKRFEVADIQASRPGGQPDVQFLPGGKLTARSVSLKEMIAAAYEVEDEYVTGGPAWLDTERYDIVAKAAGISSEKDLIEMLRNLLTDRFKLAFHQEKKPMPVYVLTVDKKGTKLQQSAAGEPEKTSCKLVTPQGRKDGLILRTLTCKKADIALLAERLHTVAAAYLEHPVVDLTEMKGQYDFTLEWAPRRGGRGVNAAPAGTAESADPDGPTIFNAVQSQLGLKLEPRKYPMDIIVVDQVERTPTDQ